MRGAPSRMQMDTIGHRVIAMRDQARYGINAITCTPTGFINITNAYQLSSSYNTYTKQWKYIQRRKWVNHCHGEKEIT